MVAGFLDKAPLVKFWVVSSVGQPRTLTSYGCWFPGQDTVGKVLGG